MYLSGELSQQLINKYIVESSEVLYLASQSLPKAIDEATSMLIKAFSNNNKVLICGNGGSAADAQHFAAELTIRFEKSRRGLPAIALSTDTSIITAAGNDFGFETVFARQVEALGSSGDVLIAISTSGNSPNIVKAAHVASDKGLKVIGLTGQSPNQLSEFCHLTINAPGNSTADIQLVHLVVIHAICKLVDSVYDS
jgi:D-sedoheptulose 7-phosphate isomerase